MTVMVLCRYVSKKAAGWIALLHNSRRMSSSTSARHSLHSSPRPTGSVLVVPLRNLSDEVGTHISRQMEPTWTWGLLPFSAWFP